MNDWQYYFSSVLLCVVFFQTPLAAQVAAAAKQESPTETKIEKVSGSIAADEENLIHSADLIEVDVVGSTEFDWRGTLNAEGFLNGVNFTENPIYAVCQTEESVAAQIAKSYSRILRSPQVVVRIFDRSKRPAAVLFGAVKKNQRFQIKRLVFLNELIVVSGGFTDRASGEIQIIRSPNVNCLNEISSGQQQQTGAQNKTDEAQYINVKIADLLAGKENPRILSGDVVTVHEAKPIYVIGAVGVPKQIAVRAEITLSRAVDSAGGILKNADAAKVVIFRRAAGESKTIEADLNKIKAGQAEDVVLQAYDVVEVSITGREKRKFPPVLKTDETGAKAWQSLPLRIID